MCHKNKSLNKCSPTWGKKASADRTKHSSHLESIAFVISHWIGVFSVEQPVRKRPQIRQAKHEPKNVLILILPKSYGEKHCREVWVWILAYKLTWRAQTSPSRPLTASSVASATSWHIWSENERVAKLGQSGPGITRLPFHSMIAQTFQALKKTRANCHIPLKLVEQPIGISMLIFYQPGLPPLTASRPRWVAARRSETVPPSDTALNMLCPGIGNEFLIQVIKCEFHFHFHWK